jgi:pimeloyl-ACP methyl ester carboxylesterase
METLDVGGTPVEVQTMGSGPPLVYLHSEQFVARTAPFLEALAARFRVISARMPGFGATTLPADIRTVDDLAYLHLDLLHKLDLKQPTVVGASFGGWVALEMAVRNTARIGRLALIGAVGVKLSGREERDFADIFYLSDAEAFPVLFADPEKWAPKYAALPVTEVEQLARERQALAYYAWKPYLHNPGLRRWLHRVDVPTLVLWGDKDRFASPDYGLQLASRLPNAEFKIVSRAGHYPQIEQVPATVEAISSFAGR